MKKNLLTVICFAIIISAGISQTIDTLTVDIEHGRLEGTLLVPVSEGKMPLALIIAGSGPTDRDGNNTMMKNNSLKMMAEGLAENGIASLRYDKRGVGKSMLTGVKESQIRFEDFIEDAGKWLGYLTEDVRFGEITIIGHSEGSLIGMILSQNGRAGKFISIAGAGEPAGIIIRKQLKAQPPFILEQAKPILDKLENGETVDSVPQMLYSLFRPDIQPYIISWFKYDPQVEIAKLDKPVLIIQGTTDIQVSIEDAENLAAANPGAKKIIIEGMNHVLKEAQAERMENILTYSNPDLPLKDGLLETIVRFIKSKDL